MTRISLLCLAISIVFSQAVHAQPSIRLGAGGSKLGGETDDLIVSNFSLGYNVMAGLESPLSPSASILLECAYVSNKFDGFLVNLSGSQSIIQANVGIKLSSHFLRLRRSVFRLYLVGVIGYNRSKTTIDSKSFYLGRPTSVTENNIGAGAGVGLNTGSLFSEARLYYSRATENTYLLGIVGIKIP